MKRLAIVLCGMSSEAAGRAAKRALAVCVLSAALSGCASQQIVLREYYPPDEKTAVKREDGLTVGALKSEAVKSGQPDWSTKNISILTVGL